MKYVFTVLSIFIVTLSTIVSPTLAGNRMLSLDGFGDYVQVPPSASLNITDAITIEAWVFLKTVPTESHSQAWASKYLGQLAWDIHSNGFFISRDGNENDMLEFSIPRQEWVHVVCVYDGLEQRVYVNGILDAQRDWPGGIASSGSPIQIGTHYEQYWPGMLDEIRIWNVARTAEDIQADMDSPLTEGKEGLAGYWNFDDGTANDLSSHGNHGILHGDATILEIGAADWRPMRGEINTRDGFNAVVANHGGRFVLAMRISRMDEMRPIKTIDITLPDGFASQEARIVGDIMLADGKTIGGSSTQDGQLLKVVLDEEIAELGQMMINFEAVAGSTERENLNFSVKVLGEDGTVLTEELPGGEGNGNLADLNDFSGIAIVSDAPVPAPTGVAAETVPGENDLQITWIASTDKRVKGYQILVDGGQLKTVYGRENTHYTQ